MSKTTSRAYKTILKSSGQTRFTSGAATKNSNRSRDAYAEAYGGVIKDNGDIGFS